MAFCLMRYTVAAMQRQLEAGHKQLPPVIGLTEEELAQNRF
jgi:predicted transposase YdaD